MAYEHQSLMKNNTWVLSDFSLEKLIGCKQVYKVKYKADGTLDKYKAQLIAKWFTQEGIDNEETFGPMAKTSIVHLVLALSDQFRWCIHWMDVKSAFLNDLQEEVYITSMFSACSCLQIGKSSLQPQLGIACIKIDKYLIDQGFKHCPDSNLYVKHASGEILILVIYVDDLIITGSATHLVEQGKQILCQTFDMTSMGLSIFVLVQKCGKQILPSLVLSQSMPNVCWRNFGCRMVKPHLHLWRKGQNIQLNQIDQWRMSPHSGNQWAALSISLPPDLTSARYISRFMTAPKAEHCVGVKRVLRYVKGTPDFGFLYNKSQDPHVIGFTDSDWEGFVDDQKSISGHVFSLGTWTSKKYLVVSLSSTEAEYQELRQLVRQFPKNEQSTQYLLHTCDAHRGEARRLLERSPIPILFVKHTKSCSFDQD